MVQLQRIGKDKVINHHHDVPYKVLNKSYTFGDENSGNKIIHGDNLEALKSLLPQYEDKIDCIYIDPPYNTGKEQRVYNDNVNDPKIRKWLNEVVGKEGEDLSRHDKWLCMMYPRLKLLQKLLSDKGVIFISIDDNEQSNLKLLCDEIFGPSNFISMLSIENNPKGRKNSDFISVSNEYCLIYAKCKSEIEFMENIPKNVSDLALDENGNYVHNSGKRILVGEQDFNEPVENLSSDKHYSVYYNKELYDIKFKKESDINEVDSSLIEMGYERYISFNNEVGFILNTYSQNKLKELFDEEALEFKNNKIYEKNFSTSIRMKSMVVNKKYDAVINNNVVEGYEIDVKTTSAGTMLKNIFGTKKTVFENPKNIGLIKLLLSLLEDKNLVVLDSFAGSGTTAHAVLDLNKQDGGNRKFILVELGDYAESITAERTKRVINGYSFFTKSKNKRIKNEIEGLGGGFDFYELGDPLFIDNEYLNENVGIEVLRDYIWYTETKSEVQNIEKNNEYYLGSEFNTDYYFYYKKDEITILDVDFLSTIAEKNEQIIIYADKCHLSKKFMQENGIVFKKIPRDITRF